MSVICLKFASFLLHFYGTLYAKPINLCVLVAVL